MFSPGVNFGWINRQTIRSCNVVLEAAKTIPITKLYPLHVHSEVLLAPGFCSQTIRPNNIVQLLLMNYCTAGIFNGRIFQVSLQSKTRRYI